MKKDGMNHEVKPFGERRRLRTREKDGMSLSARPFDSKNKWQVLRLRHGCFKSAEPRRTRDAAACKARAGLL